MAAEKKLKLGLWPAGFQDYYYPNADNTRSYANVSPCWTAPLPEGQRQTIDLFDVPSGTTAHVMVISIGSNGIWSRGSNVSSGKVTVFNPSDGKYSVSLRPENKATARHLLSIRTCPVPDGAIGIIVEGADEPAGADKLRLSICNLQGRVAGSLVPDAAKGAHRRFVWRPAGSSPGMYLAIARRGNGSASLAFILIKHQ